MVSWQNINQGMFLRAYLGWSLKLKAQNYLFYSNIEILCAKISCNEPKYGILTKMFGENLVTYRKTCLTTVNKSRVLEPFETSTKVEFIPNL